MVFNELGPIFRINGDQNEPVLDRRLANVCTTCQLHVILIRKKLMKMDIIYVIEWYLMNQFFELTVTKKESIAKGNVIEHRCWVHVDTFVCLYASRNDNSGPLYRSSSRQMRARRAKTSWPSFCQPRSKQPTVGLAHISSRNNSDPLQFTIPSLFPQCSTVEQQGHVTQRK